MFRFGLYSDDIDSAAVDDNEWTHLTFVYNSNGRKSLYVDGHLAGTELVGRYTPSTGFNSLVRVVCGTMKACIMFAACSLCCFEMGE